MDQSTIRRLMPQSKGQLRNTNDPGRAKGSNTRIKGTQNRKHLGGIVSTRAKEESERTTNEQMGNSEKRERGDVGGAENGRLERKRPGDAEKGREGEERLPGTENSLRGGAEGVFSESDESTSTRTRYMEQVSCLQTGSRAQQGPRVPSGTLLEGAQSHLHVSHLHHC